MSKVDQKNKVPERRESYQEQPVKKQYFAQPDGAPVQYVVMAESVKGVRGWLLFSVICFAFAGLGYISKFFVLIAQTMTIDNAISVIFSLALAVLSILAVVFMSMQKKTGKYLAIAAISTSALYFLVSSILGDTSNDIARLMSAIVTSLVVHGLVMLYFFVSRRVKETLVN